MKRYCIKDCKKESDYANKNGEDVEQKIKINGFAILYAYLSQEKIYPECQEELSKILIKSCAENRIHTDSESEMYRSIFNVDLKSDIVELDIYLHIYYTLLYERNKNAYVPLVEAGWTEEKKREIRLKRKEYNRNIENKSKERLPFRIVEKENSSSKGGRLNEETKILDFAPDISRLVYLSKEFRTVFGVIKSNTASKYSYSRIKKLFENNNAEFKRKESIWLAERLFGINLTWALYSFFSIILKNMNFKDVEKEFEEKGAGSSNNAVNIKHYIVTTEKEIKPIDLKGLGEAEAEETVSSVLEYIKAIIHEIMTWQGVYSRTELIKKLKIVAELKIRSDKKIDRNNPEKILQYLYEQVVKQRMDELSDAYKAEEARIYCEKKEKEGMEDAFEKVGKKCDELMNGCFSNKEKYCLLKCIEEFVSAVNMEDNKEVRENSTQEEIREKALKENLYKLIQKIVISEGVR